MKKLPTILISLFLAAVLSLFSGCEFEKRTSGNGGAQASDSLPGGSASLPVSSDRTSATNSGESPTDEPFPEADDLAVNGCASSRAPVNYGTLALFQTEEYIVSENSAKSLKGSFNNVGAPVYNGTDIWTFAQFDLSAYYGGSVNLREKTFQMDLLTENCHSVSSVIFVDQSGSFSAETPFDNNTVQSSSFIRTQRLSDGWRRITINPGSYYAESEITSVSLVLITFSNVNCNYYADSVFYIDNVRLGNAEAFPDPAADVKVYNPSGYYSKDTPFKVKIVGNSFISTSQSAYWLEQLSFLGSCKLFIDDLAIGYGRIKDQINAAFGSDGYMNDEYGIPDVLFIQDFYGYEDVTDLAVFLNSLYSRGEETGWMTEVKIYPAENETEDGKRAAAQYGLDLVNWKGFLTDVKAALPFTSVHLNYQNDPIAHSNALAGFFGGAMMYFSLYGELPGEEAVNLVLGSCDFIPGATETEKRQNINDALRSIPNYF